jgi:peptidoglycan hydrolase-like protein with peptidoglycan-binding domain
VDVRFKAAQEVRELIQGQAVENIDNSVSEPRQELFWPPRMLCQGMNGADVQLLQSALMCHGYNCGGTSGIFDVRTHNMVLAFQTEHELDVDGIAGPKTFKALGVTW